MATHAASIKNEPFQMNLISVDKVDHRLRPQRYLVYTSNFQSVLQATNASLAAQDSPVDQVEVRGQAVALEVAEETREILLEENLEGGKILQHLAEREPAGGAERPGT